MMLANFVLMCCLSFVLGRVPPVYEMQYHPKHKDSNLCFKTPPSTCYNASQVQPNYEYLLFSQEWPGAFCLSHACSAAARDVSWNIHGLWPSSMKESDSPCYCPGPPFSASKINVLSSDLNIYWLDLKGNGDEFYVHEWCKHGRCFSSHTDELDYFNATLTLRKKIDVFKVLQSGNIVPSYNATYTSNDVINVLRRYLNGVTPNIMCTKYKNLDLLQEVHICFDPHLDHFVDCPESTLDVKCTDEIYYYPNSK